jgi:DNA gyrase subunit A
VEGIRVSGRNTQGVKLMNLDEGDRIIDVARVMQEDDDDSDDGADDGMGDEDEVEAGSESEADS